MTTLLQVMLDRAGDEALLGGDGEEAGLLERQHEANHYLSAVFGPMRK